ncbi:MAG: 50S ribosomal protein P1 [Candidatus Thermoplasmatota archaeon]|nr:50S ribosomal protein P1 [Candidatus Thermoplasmatota archaeon]MCL5731313.1 50S ribosomal protein P1 [Candidatus Thermoplasmatota archaeon]
MEYVYGALLLHSAGSEIEEEKLKKVLESAGVKPDDARVKSVVGSLKGVNIEDVLKNAAATTVAAPAHAAPASGASEKKETKKEEHKEEKKQEGSEDDALAGLSSLFG